LIRAVSYPLTALFSLLKPAHTISQKSSYGQSALIELLKSVTSGIDGSEDLGQFLEVVQKVNEEMYQKLLKLLDDDNIDH
jgi:hypothetical protein